MARNNIKKLVFIIATILTCVSIGCLIAGVAGNNWFHAENHNFGLFTNCVKFSTNIQTCKSRNNLLKFAGDETWIIPLKLESASTYFDTVLTMIIVALLFLSCTLLFLIVGMLCVNKHRQKFTLLCSGIAAIFAACAAVAAVGYSEYIHSKKIEKTLYSIGWSAILAWVGATSAVLTSIITITSQFLISNTTNEKYRDNNIPIEVSRYENKGYLESRIGNSNSRHNSEDLDSTRPSTRTSRATTKPELTHDKPLQPKYIYDDNKRNKRYKYTYNPEYMEQQYREQESPYTQRQKYAPPDQYNSQYLQNHHNNDYYYDDDLDESRNYNPQSHRHQKKKSPSYHNSGYEIR